jgi:hypothetical protein
MDISLHDAAEFMRNSQMNKNDITTSNLTVHDNALFDFNKVSYKTSNVYKSDLQQYPPVDLSDSSTHIRLENTDYTQFIMRLSNDDMYILKSNDDLFLPDDSVYDGSKIINIFNTDDKYWMPHAIEGISSPGARLYSTAIGNYVYTSSFQSPVSSSTGNWLYIELPREIVLTKISFKTDEYPVHQFTIFGKNDVEYINILTKTLPDHFKDVEVEISDNSAVYSKYLIVFNSLYDYSLGAVPFDPSLQINSFNLFGYTQTNIVSLQNILQNKQDKLTTDYGLQIVDNNLQFDTVFMQMMFYEYNTNYEFTLNRLPYKFIGEAGLFEPWKYRIFDVSIVDNVNENLIYSYVVKVGTNHQVINVGNYIIKYVPVFSYFSTSTVTQIDSSVQFGDWATIRFKRSVENDDDLCGIEIHKNCAVNIVSR